MIRQWIPDSWSGDRKCTGLKDAAANSRNWQLMTSGRSQVLATSNFRDWHTVVGEIPWSSVLKTTMDCHVASLYCTRWRITSQCRSSCISRDRPRSFLPGPSHNPSTQLPETAAQLYPLSKILDVPLWVYVFVMTTTVIRPANNIHSLNTEYEPVYMI